MRVLIAVLLLAASSLALAAPTVSMTSPANGALYLAPGTLPVKANASSSGATITKVEFYANGTLIQTDTTNPYQFDWSGVAAGSYSITAVAYDSNGASTTSSPRNIVIAASNTPPTVSLSTPADNSRYLNPSGISISATASGPELNDIIASVAFYLNGSLAQTITSAPFSYNATGLAVGTYTLTAVATDSQGAQTTTAARTFTVSNTNVPPTVSLVIPQDNTKWNAPATVTFQASVNSGEANDTVSVEFFANGVSQGVRSSSPFSLTQSLAAATYTITAVATDGQGAQTTSAARTIIVSDTNNAPTVSISSPAPNANFPTAPAGFTLTAAANSGEINGWITKVEFYVNGTLVNTDTTAPYSYAVSGLASGTYTLTAVATDQLNAQTTSAPVVVSVGAAPLAGYFIQTDHLNTPRAIYDASQQVRWRWDQQEPFGVNVPDENPGGAGAFEFPQRFPGQYADKEGSLFYNMARDYSPDIGRYIEFDPIGVLPFNLPARRMNQPYAYVKTDPLRYTDPSGLCPCPGCTWDQAVGFSDWQVSVGFGGYYSQGKVNFTCRGDLARKCTATQKCIGGGAIATVGLSWNIGGTAYNVCDTRDFLGWSGAQGGGSFSIFSGQGGWGEPGGSGGAGPGVGGGVVVYMRCIYVDLKCSCPTCPNKEP